MTTKQKLYKILGKAVLSVIFIILTLITAELIFRIYRHMRPARTELDPVLGWRTGGNIVRDYTGYRSDNKPYKVHYTSLANGFREWGSTNSSAMRVLCIGDSFTEAVQVSSDKTYYHKLKEKLGNAEMFGYGNCAYGNLQEFLIIRQYLNEIKPDLIIWQWCANDLCNNSFEMDDRSHWNFNVYPRPFLDGTNITVRWPKEIPIISRHSQLWLWIAPRIGLRLFKDHPSAVDTSDVNSPYIKHAIETTDRILSMSTNLTGKIPIIAFTVGEPLEYQPLFEQLAAKHGIIHFDINSKLSALRKNGTITDASDRINGHWCEEGHEAVANIILEVLRTNGLAGTPALQNKPD